MAMDQNYNKIYLQKIKERAKTSKIYKKYQATGLTIAQLLNDDKHKSLYIKLAKQYNNELLIQLAVNIHNKTKIKNKGGYFMKVLQNYKQNKLYEHSNHK
ncbi:MAG: hypothetical protein ACP5IC_00220 [Minisyncoccia bacterium]